MTDEKKPHNRNADAGAPVPDEQLEEVSGGAMFPGQTRYSTVKLERASAGSDGPGRSLDAEQQALDEILD